MNEVKLKDLFRLTLTNLCGPDLILLKFSSCRPSTVAYIDAGTNLTKM